MSNITKILVCNVFLLVYLFSPNFTVFLGIALSMMFTSNGKQWMEYLFGGNNQTFNRINYDLNRFLAAQALRGFMFLFCMKVILQTLWFVPSWIIIMLCCEIYCFWDFSDQVDVKAIVIEKFFFSLEAISKLDKCIPRYQQKQMQMK